MKLKYSLLLAFVTLLYELLTAWKPDAGFTLEGLLLVALVVLALLGVEVVEAMVRGLLLRASALLFGSKPTSTKKFKK